MLIALDWGTSTLRAFLLGPDGGVRDERAEPWGILSLPPGGFAAALAAITAAWPAECPVIACGMVGSRGGWHEAPYLPTPSAPSALAAGAVAVPDAPRPILLVPGLRHDGDVAAPDVMRGEETQAIGAAVQFGPDALLVMPGTHAKWARVADGAVTGFRTFMTGELHAVLLAHSILGRLVPPRAAPEFAPGVAPRIAPEVARDAGPDAPPDQDVERAASGRADAFARGVRAGHARGALPMLFSARALPLTGALDPARIPDYLSGLLLGDELRAGLAGDVFGDPGAPAVPIAVVGDGALARRTADAFVVLGHPRPPVLAGTAPAGLARIAASRGLIAGEPRPC